METEAAMDQLENFINSPIQSSDVPLLIEAWSVS